MCNELAYWAADYLYKELVRQIIRSAKIGRIQKQSSLPCRKSSSNNLQKIVKRLVKEISELRNGKARSKRLVHNAHAAVKLRYSTLDLDRLSNNKEVKEAYVALQGKG